MRTYTIRFPDSSREGVTKEAQKEYLAAMVRKSPAVARLVDMMNMLKSLLSVNPRSRPSKSLCTSGASPLAPCPLYWRRVLIWGLDAAPGCPRRGLNADVGLTRAAHAACTEALNFNIFTLGMGAPAIKSQELLKLQMTSAQAEAQQLALMEVLCPPSLLQPTCMLRLTNCGCSR